MKKLLSICILSILLMMMSFTTAQAQSSNQCCFWVENMQPVTFPHIANLDGTGIAQDTSAGMDLVLNNVLNMARKDSTDIYRLHFPAGANCGTKVSIEWLLYRDGQLVNGNLSDYAEVGIYTRNGVCQNINWLGGIVDDGDGVCGCDPATWHVNHNDFPGARQANPLAPAYFDESHHAAGYTHVMYTYNFDYFYLPFLASEHSTTDFVIKWKQVGNYALVVRIRERIGGTDYDFTMDGSQNPEMYIGGHQSCCGQILYQDSLHYLVTTAHEKSICDNDDPFMYGRGQRTATGSTLYAFSEESLYYVLFGDYDCDHWNVEYIDTLQLYTRINPDIIARDTNLCRDESFDADDLLGLVTEVDLDAPGIIGHEIQWSQNNVNWSADMSRLTQLNNMTVVAGVYTFYVRQHNFYYDAMTQDTIGCAGAVDTVTVNVRDLFPPVLDNEHLFTYCNEDLEENSPLVLTAHIDEDRDHCATEIRWFIQDEMGMPNHLPRFQQAVGDTLSLDLSQVNPQNDRNTITYYLYTVNANTNTYSAEYDSLTIEFHQTPIFTVEDTQMDYVVCPGASVTLRSMVSSVQPDYNGELPTVTYEWYLGDNDTPVSTDTNYTLNASVVCNHIDTFTLKVKAVSFMGCENNMTRTYTIKAQDIENPVIAWDTTGATFDTLGNKIRTLSGCDSSAVPAPYTLADFAVIAESTADVPATAVGTIIDGCVNVNTLNVTDVVTSHTACQTVVTRTYEAVDACENHSNIISEIFTINNDFKPVISGLVDVNPVRDSNCTYNVPSYAVLRNIFDNDTHINVAYNCTESTFDTVVFYINNTDVVADGNLNIFANADLVTIYAVVTDDCGNVSVKTPVFQIHKPAPMYIAHGAITLDTLELCADVTTNMHFNDNFVMNADRPYTYQWSQISVVGQSIITPDPNNYLEAVIAPEDQMLNTSSHFIMTVTDSLGCVAADTSNAVHFYRLPTAEIISHPDNFGNPIHDGDTLCPNYGDFYVKSGNSVSNLPDSVINYQSLGYLWSGASDVLNKYTDTSMFKMACENCDSLYTTYLTVTNMKNCSATTSFNIYGALRAEDTLTVTAIEEKTMPLVSGRNDCVISVPDFVSTNVYFNSTTVQHNCFSLSEMEITQDVTPGTFVNHDTTVVITIRAPRNLNNPDAVPCLTYTHRIEVKMPANTVHISDITSSNVGCEPLATTLTPTVVNATGTCTWAWSTGATTESINVTMTTAAHTYTLTVTDQAGCSSTMTVSPVVYRKPVRSDIEFVSTPNTYCDGAVDGMNNPVYDGTFTINVLNENAEIDGYKWNADNYTPYRPVSYVYTGLVQNAYDFTVYTTHGCYATFTDTVKHDTTDLNIFTAARLHDNFKCESPYEGSVQVTPNIENYVYQISSDTHFTDGEVITSDSTVITPIMFNWLYQDTYRVYVVSPKGCHFVTNDVTVLDVTDTPTTHIVTYDTADCHLPNVAPNGRAKIANSNPTYTYTIDNVIQPGNNGTLVFSNLESGSHILTIKSSGNCVFTQTIVVPSWSDPGRPIATIDTNRACAGGTYSGAITIEGANVKDGYTYKLYSYIYGLPLVDSIVGVAGTPVVFNNLVDGVYQWHVTDNHNCSATYMDTVPFKAFTFDTNAYVITPGTRCDTADNLITITAPNSDYNYILYQVGYYSDDLIDTFPANGILMVHENGDNYYISKIHKQSNCIVNSSTFGLHVNQPVYNFTVAHTPDHDCSALGTGSITVNSPSTNYSYYLYEGNAYYDYEHYAYYDENYGTDYLSADSTAFINLDGNGYYNYQLYTIFAVNHTTACSYKLVDTIRLDTYYPVIETVVSTPNYNCIAEKNGTITVTLDSVVPGTYYLYAGYSTEVANNTTGVFTGLNSLSNYRVHFVSDLHCSSSDQYIAVVDSAFIETEFVVTPNYSCESTINQPGTGCIYVMEPHNNAQHNNYTYSLTLPGVWETNSIDIPSYKWCSLDSGTYTVVISDALTGCVATDYVYVPRSTVHVTLDVVATDNNICTQGIGNGSITVTATADNLDAVLLYSIDGGTTWHNSGATINNLPSGNYVISVKDTWFNCQYDTCANKDVTINTVKKQLNVTFATVNNTACDPALYNGSITITGVKYNDGSNVNYSDTLTNVDYSVVDYATTITNGWGHLNGIEYKVTITDNTTGCDTTISVTLTTENICSPSIAVSALNNNKHVGNDYYFCLGTVDAQLVAEASSACDPTFTYTWTRDCHPIISNTNTMDVWTGDVFSCTYTVTAVGDSSGCSSTKAVTVVVDPNPTIQFYATPQATIQYLYANPTVTYTNCENYAFNLGIENHHYDSIVWSNGYVDTNVYQFTVPAYQLSEGMTSYCVWVMDNNGCTANSVANVITRPVARYATSMEVCGSFHYVSNRTSTVYDYSYTDGGTNTYTVVDTFDAVNSCDSIVTYTVTIKANPTLDVLAARTALGTDSRCDGVRLPATFAITTNHATASGYRITNKTEEQLTKTSFMTDTPFDPSAPLTRNMNGMNVYAYAYNACDTVYDMIGTLLVDALPVVSTISGDPHFCAGADCPGTQLSADVINWNQTAATPRNKRWLISDNTDFTAAAIVGTLHGSDSGRYVTFAAENRCGTTFATPIQIHVDSVAAPTLVISDATYCAGDAIAATDITITHNATSTPTATSYTLGGFAYTLGTPLTIADNGKEFVANVTYECGTTPVASNPVAITVLDTARLELPTTPDTLCIAGGAQTYTAEIHSTNVLSATSSDNTKATVTCSGATFTVTPVAAGDVTITLVSTAASCGSKTKTVRFFIGQKPVVNTPANVTACAGDIITPAVPSITPNGNIRNQGWKINGTDADLTTTHMTMAMNGAQLTYYVENFCGTTVSAYATITVKDTAHLAIGSTISTDDTVCVGGNIDVTGILVNSTNDLSYEVLPAGAITFNKTGNEHSAPGATLTLTGAVAGNVNVTITSTGAAGCGDPKTETFSFVVSEPAEVAAIVAPDAVCEGEALALTAPAITDNGNSNIHAQGWEVKRSGETAFAAFDPTTLMTLTHDGDSLRYMVENVCGTVYSNVVTISVNDTAQLTAPTEATQTVCNNSAIADIVMTSNKPLVLSTELTDAGLSVTGYMISGIVSIDENETFPYTLTGTVSTNDTECPDKNKTKTITITVNEKPTATLSVPADTLCAGAEITPTLDITYNHSATPTNAYFIKTKTATSYSAFTITTPVTVDIDSALIYNKVENGCGFNYTDTVVVRVAGAPVVSVASMTFRDTCSGNPLSDFIVSGAPVVTLPSNATVILSQGWYKKDGSNYVKIEYAADSVITEPTTIAYGVTTQCTSNPVMSDDVVLGFDYAPTFVDATPFTIAAICEGQKFNGGVEPTVNVNANGGVVTNTWTINGEALDFNAIYDAATYNGKKIKLVIANDCGSTEYDQTITINPLPVPQMLGDTTICADPAYSFTLQVVNGPFDNYSWKDANGTEVATTATYSRTLGTALAVDTVLTYYVVVKDANGCYSETQINVSADTISSDVITVKVTGKPYFVFTNLNGVQTHDINSSTNNETTGYRWTLENCDYPTDTKVFVQFSIYHNGVLIPNDSVSSYISSYNDIVGGHTYTWNNKQYFDYVSGDGTPGHSSTGYYVNMDNHYPNDILLNGAVSDYSWFYLHFLTSRYMTHTLFTFVTEGDYEIHYELYSCDGNEFGNYYKNGSSVLRIGGHDLQDPIALLASDVFTIHVNNSSAVAENEAPEAPSVDPIASEPTVKVYPNPAAENVNVRVEGVSGQTVVRITTLTGKTVAERTTNFESKSNVETFNVADLTPGVYVLQIVNDEAIISRKLVIAK